MWQMIRTNASRTWLWTAGLNLLGFKRFSTTTQHLVCFSSFDFFVVYVTVWPFVLLSDDFPDPSRPLPMGNLSTGANMWKAYCADWILNVSHVFSVNVVEGGMILTQCIQLEVGLPVDYKVLSYWWSPATEFSSMNPAKIVFPGPSNLLRKHFYAAQAFLCRGDSQPGRWLVGSFSFVRFVGDFQNC